MGKKPPDTIPPPPKGYYRNRDGCLMPIPGEQTIREERARQRALNEQDARGKGKGRQR